MNRIRARLTYANVVATIALFLALTGGVVWAAKKVGSKNIKRGAVEKKHIAKNAVRKKHIKDNQVDGSKIRDGAVGRADLAGGSVGPAQIVANAVGAQSVAPNSLGGAQINEGTLEGVDAATVKGVEFCRARETITVGPGELDSTAVCSIGGFELELFCEADGSASAASTYTKLSPPANDSMVSIEGTVDSAAPDNTDISPSNADLDAADEYELARTTGFTGSPRISDTVSVVASTPGGQILSGRLAMMNTANGSTGSCTVIADLQA
ncbi:MAG TPA: hypothetical protein VKA36_03710 [Solirubrobacterales bacterium]|nr:hypothetical protein [Solirubrobacterales bacterium]